MLSREVVQDVLVLQEWLLWRTRKLFGWQCLQQALKNGVGNRVAVIFECGRGEQFLSISRPWISKTSDFFRPGAVWWSVT